MFENENSECHHKSIMDKYDVVIIGGGPGGYVSAIKAAQRGAKVAVVEKAELGGVCLNRGCIPTKTLLASVEALRTAKRLDEFGIAMSGELKPDISSMHARMRKVVDTLVKGIAGLFKANKIALLRGEGFIVGKDRVQVNENEKKYEVQAERIIIATGSRPAVLAGLEPDGKKVLNSDHILEYPAVPASILIIGAGAIGCEWGCLFSSLGSQVTIVEMMERVLPLEDEEMSQIIEREFKKQKIKVKTGVKISKLIRETDKVRAELDDGETVEAEIALVSIGRTRNTDKIGLENIGVKVNNASAVEVNEKMETSVAGIYAIGDVVPTPMLAHVASAEGIVSAINATGGEARMDYTAVPSCTFTYPEVAGVGMREWELKKKELAYKVGRFDFRALGKAHASGEISGRVKVIVDESDVVIGVHIVGHSAPELIHEGAIAVRNKLTVEQLIRTIHAHPTFSEAILEASEDIRGEAIHVPPRH